MSIGAVVRRDLVLAFFAVWLRGATRRTVTWQGHGCGWARDRA